VLTSVLSNLLHNAVKYMGNSTERSVLVRVLDQQIKPAGRILKLGYFLQEVL